MQTRRERRRRREGFTLMEVLLVMAILVILGTLVVANFSNILVNTNKRTAQTQMNLFKEQLGIYYIDVGSYPTAQDGLAALRTPPSTSADKWAGPYILEDIPKDPWGQDYQYSVESSAAGNVPVVVLSSNGADMQPGTADDITVRVGG